MRHLPFISFGMLASRPIASGPSGLDEKAEIPGLPNIRYVITSGDMPELTREGIECFEREKAFRKSQGLSVEPMPKASFLALSGGGDDGAFGAGLLNGWTHAGNRPEFKLVTGISTGALLAPFAFIGSSQDQTLARVYTQTTRVHGESGTFSPHALPA